MMIAVADTRLQVAANTSSTSSSGGVPTWTGVAGLAISLALQNSISNVIAGVMMQHDGIIRLGDDVQYGSGGARGEVVKLSLR
ncbi:MAG: mechanosensitive ion channel [Nitrososphaerota archaeon]|nr:mechanosensitive ion channel [Nitrososphaerota archaeon]MDG7023246.1 mechanosensitive ion channel [Nitrososphaerota archaeon]